MPYPDNVLLRLSLLALVWAAPLARAQLPIPIPPALVVDSVPPFERPNGALLRSGSLTYTLSLTKQSGQIVPLGTRNVIVSEAALGGESLWLIAESRRGAAVETTDSVYLAKADLTPTRWTSTIGRSQLGASFSRDSMFGVVDSYRGRSSFAQGVPSTALLSVGMVERVIELLPLRAGYRAGATLILIDGGTPGAVSTEIVMEREDRIEYLGRSVDTWRVVLRAGAREQRLWVTRDGSRVVRTEQALPDGVLTAVLQP